MKKNNFTKIALLIAFLGFLLRLYKLGEVPPSLHWDEAAFGYNAYSLLQTGRDEYGKFLPFILKSFGDFKPAFYVYLVAISEAVFGLGEFSVRLPSALFGSLTIFLLFLVVRDLFPGFKEREKVALFSSFVLAASSWHFHYSHSGWEISVLMPFLLLGIWFFLKADREKTYFLYLAAFFLGFGFYIYQGAKLLVPLVSFGLLLFLGQKLKQFSLKATCLAAGVLALLAVPVYFSAFFGQAGGRLKVMSVFSYPRSNQEVEKIAKEEEGTPQGFQFRLFHGSAIYYARGILGRYLNHFSPRFLFFEGDFSNPRHGVPSAGVLNHLAILFLPLGAYFLVSQKIKNQAFIWYLLLIAPLPAALTRDVVQATRSLIMVFPLAVIFAFGIYCGFQIVKKWPGLLRWGLMSAFALGFFFSFVFYLDQFFIHAPVAYSADWLYGYKQAVLAIKDKVQGYDQVVFTQKYGQPYIYWLFYTKYDPRKYQLQAKLIESPEGDVGRVEKIDNLFFRDIYWPKDRFEKNCLFISGPYELPEKDIVSSESRLLGKIKFINGETAFHIVETVK